MTKAVKFRYNELFLYDVRYVALFHIFQISTLPFTSYNIEGIFY